MKLLDQIKYFTGKPLRVALRVEQYRLKWGIGLQNYDVSKLEEEDDYNTGHRVDNSITQ